MDRYTAWRAAVENDLSGKPFETLIATTFDGLRIEPLVPPGTPSPALPPRFSTPRTGGIVRGALPAPEGPSLTWWVGRPGVPSPTTEVAIAEGDGAIDSLRSVEVIVVGTRAPTGVRLASPAGLSAAEAGAGAVAELASVLAALATALDAGAAPSGLAIALSVSTDLTVDVAKLRAARRAIAGMLAVAGHAERTLPLLARQTFRSVAAIDVETNALRSTLAASAALIGGASHVALWAHDAALESAAVGGGAGADVSLDTAMSSAPPDPIAGRLSWAQGEVLTRESRLHLHDDAAYGAPLFDALTDQIGQEAWTLAKRVLLGDEASLADRIGRDAEARRRAIATRKRPIVGVSRFAGTARAGHEGPRDAAPFEALRARGANVACAVIAVGDRKLDPRVEFAREVLAITGGRLGPTTRHDHVDAALAALAPDTRLVIVAVPDAALATDGVALCRALAARSIVPLIAGKPGEHQATLAQAGARGFVYVGADVLHVLSSAVTEVAS